MKFLNFHISQRNIMLIIVLCVAIFTFSSLGSVTEGYTNNNKRYCPRCKEEHEGNIGCSYKKHRKRCNKKHEENEECNNNGNDNGNMLDNLNGSYIAPAGNTVLFGIEMPDMSEIKKKKRRNREPRAIPSSQIPAGDEDLYILKSEIVPPVCPACPNVTVCPNNNTPPPPCPPCARCPEPAFECKKVPNYSSNNTTYLPRPVLTDFSQFGM